MKKESVLGFIVWIIIFALALLFGFVFLNNYFPSSGFTRWQFVGFFAGAIVAGLVFNSILFELAHVIGAKIGRYKVLSICILGIMFDLQPGKKHFGFGKFDGLTGETKIIPSMNLPEKKKHNPVPYSIMGTVLFAIELLICVVLFVWFGNDKNQSLTRLAYFLLTMATVGALILIYNIVPFKLDTMTDGYRLRVMSNKTNKEAFNQLLYAQAGIDTTNTVAENKEVKHVENVFTQDIKLNEVYKMLSQEDYVKAEKLVDELLNDNKVKDNEKLLLRSKAQKAYIQLISKDKDEAKLYCNNYISLDDRKYMSEDGTMPCIRAYCLMAGLLDKSQSECIYVLKKAYKAYKHTPVGMQKIEIRLYNKALNKVLEAHPNWELKEYLMIEQEDNK